MSSPTRRVRSVETGRDEILVSYVVDPSLHATIHASSFAATLEMVREGLVEVHQPTFGPIYLRRRPGETMGATAPGTAPGDADR